MPDPSLALQGALVALLKADNAVSAIVGPRIYDAVPDKPTFPYLVVGDGQVVGDDNECDEASEVFVQIHAWSRAQGWPEVKQLAGAVRSAVRGASFVLPGFNVTLQEFVQALWLRDPDGQSRHAPIEFHFLVAH